IFGLIIGAWLMVAGIYIYKIYDENRCNNKFCIHVIIITNLKALRKFKLFFYQVLGKVIKKDNIL
ncbi:hypothetical protein ACI3RH_11115, partial [Lactococcus lactis]